MARPSIGLIAGSGRLPLLLAQTLRREGGGPVYAVAHRQETDPLLADWVDGVCWVRLGQFKKAFDFLHGCGVGEVVMAGGIAKTRVWQIRPDAVALRLVARLRHFHDDHLLRAVANELETQGFLVRGVGEILPRLLAQAGRLAGPQPTERQWRDVVLGWRSAKALGALDIGQGVVVRDGTVIAVEAIEGTDAMLARAGALMSSGGGVLVKVAKPQQDHRLDLPTVGPITLERLTQARLSVLALEADSTLVLDPGDFIPMADRLGIAVVALSEKEVEALEAMPSPIGGIWGRPQRFLGVSLPFRKGMP